METLEKEWIECSKRHLTWNQLSQFTCRLKSLVFCVLACLPNKSESTYEKVFFRIKNLVHFDTHGNK